MSIVDVKRGWSRRSGSERMDGEGRITQRYREGYTVLTDDAADNAAIVGRAPGIPQPGQAYPSDPWAVVMGIEPESRGPMLWEVIVTYQTPEPLAGDGDPLSEPVEYEWGTTTEYAAIDQDIDGKAILNAAEEDPDPPVMREFHDETLTVTRNLLIFDDAKKAAYEGHVNSGAFMGKPEFTVKCTSIGARLQRRADGAIYWRERVSFAIRLQRAPDGEQYGWDERRLQAGYRYNIGRAKDSSGRMVWHAATDAQGNPVSKPILLNESGGRAENDIPTWFRVKKDPRANFAGLGIPEPPNRR